MGKNKGMPSVHQLVLELQKRFDVSMLTPDKGVNEGDYSAVNIFHISTIPCVWKNKYIQFLFARINYIWACVYVLGHGLIGRYKYDLVYANYALPGAKALSMLWSIPLVVRIYGTFLYPVLSSFIQKIIKYEEIFLFNLKANLYVITDDGTSGDVVARYYGIDPSRILFLMNGVNSPAQHSFSRKDVNLPQEAKILLTTSRLANWKRVDRIIKAMQKTSANNLVLMIAGDGAELVNLKKMANMDPRILFLGALDGVMIEKLFSICDWYVTMHDVSNIGNPTLQALKSGVPVLTCATGNTEKLINMKSGNGICIEFDTELELINKISHIFNDISLNIIDARDFKDGVRNSASKINSWPERIHLEINAIEKLI